MLRLLERVAAVLLRGPGRGMTGTSRAGEMADIAGTVDV